MKTMWYPYYIQFLIYSLGVNAFLFFTFVIYYSNLLFTYTNVKLSSEYDYIIVGAGTAGSLIAHRLATETNFTFVVLEAGGRSHCFFEIPVIGPLLHGSVYDWQYETTPQEHACYAMIDRKCRLTQGKIVGGSWKLNNMIHVRGNISHYANWSHGMHSEEYFLQQLEYVENNFFHLDNIKYQSELADAILGAAKELDYNKLDKGFSKGFGKVEVTQRHGQRWTTSDNLDVSKHVVTNAMVEKVLIADSKAYGVNLLIAGEQRKIFARRGVILTAGTLNTPKILQLSGIGPAGLLKSLDIPLVQDLPVGYNLQDHIGSGLDLILLNKSLSINVANVLNPLNAFFYLQGKGPWTHPGCEVLGFLSTGSSSSPDIQVMVLPVGISSDRGSFLRKRLGITDDVWDGYFTKTFSKHTSTFFTVLLHPKSSGSVFIKSRDPKVPPVIDPRYLSAKEDVDTIIAGLKLVVRLLKTDSLSSIEAYLNTIPFPGCTHHEFFSDKYLECYVRHLTLTSYHPVGTCAMGLPESRKSVVDTSFRVLRVQNLYVADGSVLPSLPSGNINAAIAMMANIFYENNIKNVSHRINDARCLRRDGISKYLFKVCYIGDVI